MASIDYTRSIVHRPFYESFLSVSIIIESEIDIVLMRKSIQ